MQTSNLPGLVLIDRDGVINEDRPDCVKSIDEFRLLPGVGAAIAQLNQLNIKVAIITNQAVVGRGILSPEGLNDIHSHMTKELQIHGASVDHIYFCTSADNTHPNRKPNSGMLEQALADFNATPMGTPMIGDALRDLEAAASAGCPRFLVQTGKGKKTMDEGLPDHVQPVTICTNLPDAIKKILER